MYTNINILFFSDTHLGFDFPMRPRTNRRRRGEDFFKNFETVLSYARNIDSDLVIHGGDLFFRSKVPEPIVDRVYQTLTSFGNSGIPFFIVPGNYTFRNSPDVIPLSYLPCDANVVLCGHIHRQQRLAVSLKGGERSIPIIFSGSTERTSFAEKDETKGFYHLTFTTRKEHRWILNESRFIELPSRPMKDIFIDTELSTQQFESYLAKAISQIDQDSIIRFKSHNPINGHLTRLLTIKNLNQLLPSNLNFTFSSRFFHEEK